MRPATLNHKWKVIGQSAGGKSGAEFESWLYEAQSIGPGIGLATCDEKGLRVRLEPRSRRGVGHAAVIVLDPRTFDPAEVGPYVSSSLRTRVDEVLQGRGASISPVFEQGGTVFHSGNNWSQTEPIHDWHTVTYAKRLMEWSTPLSRLYEGLGLMTSKEVDLTPGAAPIRFGFLFLAVTGNLRTRLVQNFSHPELFFHSR